MKAEQEAERRWPSPNSGLYEGLRIGFRLGAEWQAEQDAKVIANLREKLSDASWEIDNARQAAYEEQGRNTW